VAERGGEVSSGGGELDGGKGSGRGATGMTEARVLTQLAGPCGRGVRGGGLATATVAAAQRRGEGRVTGEEPRGEDGAGCARARGGARFWLAAFIRHQVK
jgi:hypothetical protein